MNAPYLLIPIGLVLLILYGISLLFSRLDILTKSLHRKIWNYCLLVTFLVAAILGTLMAVQINYKMEVPWTEKVLKWHVNFGLAMSVVGIFHLIWHWKYFFPAKSNRTNDGRGGPKRPPVLPTPNSCTPTQGGFLLRKGGFLLRKGGFLLRVGGHVGPPLLVGFVGIVFQTFMVRELLGMFQGNELMLSIIMFLWLLLTGAGALTGNSTRQGISTLPGENLRKSYFLVLTLLILPVFLIPLLYYGKFLFFAPGIEAGPLAFAGFLLLILTPFCFVNGFAFTFITRLLQSSGLTISKAYAWESIGGSAGGLMCTIAIIAGIFSPPASRWIEKLYHPNDEIVGTCSGPSGRLTITKNGDQLNIFENGILVQSSENTLVTEEMAHFSMIQHPDPRNILVIGGLLSGISQELMKYPCNHIDFTEPDAQIFRMAKQLNLAVEPILPMRYIKKNLSEWINHPDQAYDVILIMLPGPQNLSLNRFYTDGFFKRLTKILIPGGIVSVMLPGTSNYLSAEAISAIGPVVNAMKKSFSQTSLFPGENNYLIAGNTNLQLEILSELKSREIPTVYISDGYFDENLFKTRMTALNQAMLSEKSVNSDLKPTAYFGQIAWWLRHFSASFMWLIAAIVSILIFTSLTSGHPAFSAMFIIGACASGIEIILLFLMQISTGSLYLFTGLLLAVFMAGLASGSLKTSDTRSRKFASGSTFTLLAFIAVTSLLAAMAIWMTNSGGGITAKTAIIIAFTFGIAWLSGHLFAYLSKLLPDPKAGGILYIYDMLGAALGALIYPMVVIPMIGLLPAIGIISASGVLALLILKVR
jgi:spermidine synthase